MTLVTNLIGIVNEAWVATAVEWVEVEGAYVAANLIIFVDVFLGFCVLEGEFEEFQGLLIIFIAYHADYEQCDY